MRYTLTTVVVIALFSCNDPVTVSETKAVADTTTTFVTDDYPVAYETLSKEAGDGPDQSKKSGDVYSVDKAWLVNDSLKQTLVFEMYTDGFRNVIFHFYSDDVPEQLIDQMELHIGEGELASLPDKKKAFSGFVKSAAKTEAKYFISDKGFQLGDDKQKAIKVYGTADKTSSANGLEILEWEFIGDQLYDSTQNLNGKPLAKDNYGHQVKMFFRNNKLIAVILHNDIP